MNRLQRSAVVLVMSALMLFPVAGRAIAEEIKDFEVALARGEYEIELRNYDAAIAYLIKALEIRPKDRTARMALGIAYSRKEVNDKAKELLQQVLAEDPENARARYELGVVLANMKEYGEANRLLATVTAAAGTGELADAAKELMEGMEQAKETGKPGIRMAAGLQYDSNVILEPDNPVTAMGRKSDWRSILSLEGSYPFLTGDRGGMEANYKFYQSLHFELEDFNVQQHDLSVTGRYAFSTSLQGSLRAGAAASYVSAEKYSTVYSLRPALSMSFVEKGRTEVFALQEERRYSASDAFPANNDRSGSATTAGIAHSQSFSKRTSAVLAYSYEQDHADKATWDAKEHKLSAMARIRLGEFHVFASLSGADRKYGASAIAGYPARHDRRWDAMAGLYRDLTRVVRLSLAEQHVVNDSNLDLYTYRRDIVGLFVEVRL